MSAENGMTSLPDPLERQPFFVVGLGASAGGLETLEQFFSHMSPDSGMSFVVVVHLDPTHKTLLPELLARYTRMEVRTAEEGMTVDPNVVYVIPANRDMTVSGGQLHLEEPQAPRGMRHTIDVFLRSLATDMEESAIAVILSGTGTDGTQGVKAVKEAGGIVVVQEEATAKYPGMPQSAIATGLADLILPAHKIPEMILEIAHRSTLLAQRKEAEPAKQITEQLRVIFRIVNSRTGHDFSAYKVSTILRRIERRMAVNDIVNISEYIRFLKEKSDESRALFKEFLIGVTSFFRDYDAFEALEQLVVPRLFENRDSDEPLRIWLAGCATGEEAYSVAMLIREYSRDHRFDLKVQIFATDIDGEAIDFARAGLYPDSIGADVTPDRLRTFFKKTDSTLQVVKPLRELIVFAQHNIIKDPPFSRLDLLVCRNLLIYLNPELQKRLLPLFAQSLKPNGFLFLGSSETVGGFTDLFMPLEKKWKIFQRRESGRRIGIEFPVAPLRSHLPEGEPVRTCQEAGISPGVLAEKMLMQRYSPPCVVINEKFDVVYFSTRTSRYLEPPVGEPSQNILKMAREGLRPALRAAVHKALSEQQTAIYRGLKIITESGEESLDLRVEPVTTPPSAKGLALVIFEPTGTAAVDEARLTGKHEYAGEYESSRDVMVQQLEEQLRITNEQLQATIERMETANEELKSSNEELMSMNEEFQSTNEELETSKEELQALNEELVTVNAELQNKVDELAQTNSDLQNFLASSDIATIFLDRQFRVKRFSPAMGKLFNLIASDIGRPLQHFTGITNYPELQEDAEKVLDKLIPVEREVSDTDQQQHYLVRVLPYRTMEDAIDGVVVTLIDITERMREELIRCDREEEFRIMFFNSIVGQAQADPLSGRFLRVNDALCQFLGYSEQELLQRTIADVTHPEDRNADASDLARLCRSEIDSFQREKRYVRADGAVVWGEVAVKLLRSSAGELRYTIAVIKDINERKIAEEKLRESEELYRAIGETINYGVWVCEPDGRNIYASPSFLKLVGMTQEQCSDFGWGNVLHPEDAADTIAAWKECIRTGELWYREHRFRGVDGEWHPVLAQGVPVRGADGIIKFWAGINLDISEQKRTEALLMESVDQARAKAAELEAILEAVPALVLISRDPDCRVIIGNSAANKLLRIPQGGNSSKSNPETPTSHFRVFHSGQELLPEELPMQRVTTTGVPLRDYEAEVVFDSGEKVSIYGNIVPLLWNEGKPNGSVAAFIDITPKVESEKEMRMAQQAAEAANRAKSDFVANISHEIRTPLTGILGMLHLLEETGLSPEQERYRNIAHNSGNTLLRVINDVLDFSRMEAGKMELVTAPFDLYECIKGSVDIFTLEAETRNIKLSLTFAPGTPEKVVGDSDRLRQLIFNLIGNALKFTEKGSITVSVQSVASGNKDLGRRMIRIDVADTGIGIPAAKQEHIFESFTQLESSLRRSYGGSGLGLAICRRLVDLMGGVITVRSEVGEGSTFTVELPADIPMADAPCERVVSGGMAPTGTVTDGRPCVGLSRILLAEDDPTICQLMKTVLTRNGFEVVLANNGQDALEKWEVGGIDLILMDVQMPLMDGLEATARIRQLELEKNLSCRIPIISLTAHAYDEDKKRCLDAGADEYLSKPLNIKKLIACIDRFK